MARLYLTPRSSCILTATGCAVASEGHYAWFLLAAASVAACATFFGDQTNTAGRLLATLTVGACSSTDMIGPFHSASGIYVKLGGAGASATVALD